MEKKLENAKGAAKLNRRREFRWGSRLTALFKAASAFIHDNAE
jgi:hypothetical protein